jgi:hypothetical protein
MNQTESFNNESDRRRFFRIADTVGIRYRALTLAEEKQWLDGELDLQPSDAYQLVDHEISLELDRLRSMSPEVVNLANLLNQKLDMLSQANGAVMDMGFTDKHQTLNVSLSACGVGFPVAAPLENGSVMLVDMLLTAEHKRVLTVGRVIGCDTLSIAGPHGQKFMARLNFERLNEETSEELIQYVLQQQRRILAAQRLAEEQNELTVLGQHKKS